VDAILTVQNLAKRYGRTQALQGVSFEVRDGEMFGLLGPNGAGKTTLLSILSGLLAADEGSATLIGQKVHPDNLEMRRLLGIVPQELAIYGDLTARENLNFFGKLYGLRGAKLTAQTDRVLAAIALDGRSNDRAETFSGGMKRRLNLGAALMHGPRLLLLDEPTAGVDPQSRNHIFEEIRRLNATGVTVIYTSHYMEEVQSLCTRVGIIDHGRLIACDTLPDLLGKLPGVVRLQLPHANPALEERLRQLPDVKLSTHDAGRSLEIAARHIQAILVQLITLLNEMQQPLLHLETQEPNLERVFLHLTGKSLRD
jgi:ABC-2 type transport system ATP-binding protein